MHHVIFGVTTWSKDFHKGIETKIQNLDMASINQLFPELSEKEEQKSPISSKMSDECFEHSPNIKSEASGELSGNESGGGCSGSHHHQSGMDSSCDSGRVSTPASLEGDYPLSRDSKFHDLSRGEKKNNFRPWEDDSNKTNETEHRVPGNFHKFISVHIYS